MSALPVLAYSNAMYSALTSIVSRRFDHLQSWSSEAGFFRRSPTVFKISREASQHWGIPQAVSLPPFVSLAGLVVA
jgi:hypothetical protein